MSERQETTDIDHAGALRLLACDASWQCQETAALLEDAADEIERLSNLLMLAFGLLWHDKHNAARREVSANLDMSERAKGIGMARQYDDKYQPDETPIPTPVGKAISALEKAAQQSQWWSVDEENDTSWVEYKAAAVMLTHWAAGLEAPEVSDK